MNALQFYNKYQGQALLWAPSPAREYLRSQCVQSVCFYVVENGKPVIWADAYEWWSRGLFPEHYERIENSATAVPQPGDIIIWGPQTPGSGGAGHIAVCLEPRPGTGTFVSVDSNWGGKTVHLVVHNYTNVVGWLRLKGVNTPAPAPQAQGEEMIANADQATKIYAMLRPNGGGTQDEINGTAGRRTFAAFLNDAQGEVNARNAALQRQSQHMAEMQNAINAQNVTIAELTTVINNDKVDFGTKHKAYEAAMTQVAQQNAEITTLRDKIADLQKTVKQPNANKPPTKAEQAEAVKEVKGIFARLFGKR